jgi:hypothetical protein
LNFLESRSSPSTLFSDEKGINVSYVRHTEEGIFETPMFGCSARDLLEGAAILESFKLTDPKPTPSRFLGYREKYFAGDSDSYYRYTFDYLSQSIGIENAYHLLSPLPFVALQGDSPSELFKTIVEDLLPEISPEELKYSNIVKIFSLLGMNANIPNLFAKFASS